MCILRMCIHDVIIERDFSYDQTFTKREAQLLVLDTKFHWFLIPIKDQ